MLIDLVDKVGLVTASMMDLGDAVFSSRSMIQIELFHAYH